MPQEPNIHPELSIYAAYTHLPVRALAELTGALSRLAERIVAEHSELARLHPERLPELEVLSVATGESIKFTFGEGWLPSVSSNEEDDIVIDVPKKLGIPLMVGYLLLTGAQKCLDLRNTQLDNQIKEVEVQLKRTELQSTIMASDDRVAPLQNEGKEVISIIQRNEMYQVFQVNGVSIIDRSESSDDQGGETNKTLE